MVEWDDSAEKSNTTKLPAASPAPSPLRNLVAPQIAPIEIGGKVGDAVIFFRRFSAVPSSRQLLVDGDPIELGSRAFDLLIALIEARGTLVTKNEIMDRVWPSTVVDESNLRVQMAALRKVLGKDRDIIKTIPGRGYIFTLEVGKGSVEPESIPKSRHEVPHLRFEQPKQAELPPIGLSDTAAKTISEGASPAIVVIDDDPDIREALHGLLRSVGLRVEVFGSVEELLRSDRPVQPSCLILDVWLPGRSGLDFYAELARSKVQLPVIFMSGHADVPMSVQAMKAGAIEFLTKPVRHQDLLNAIEMAVGSISAARA